MLPMGINFLVSPVRRREWHNLSKHVQGSFSVTWIVYQIMLINVNNDFLQWKTVSSKTLDILGMYKARQHRQQRHNPFQ